MSTPCAMRKAFERNDEISIRQMQPVDWEDPEPDMPNDEWNEKYGSLEMVYKVVVRHAEEVGRLHRNHIYTSWDSVLKAIERRVKAHETAN